MIICPDTIKTEAKTERATANGSPDYLDALTDLPVRSPS
jgi:hypothetical protein